MVSKKLPNALVINGVPVQQNQKPEFELEYLYIEEYPFEPLPKDRASHRDDENQESENRGVIVIDMC